MASSHLSTHIVNGESRSKGVKISRTHEYYLKTFRVEDIEPGDVIFHWVNEQGIRAEGRVTGCWDSSEVNDNERVYSGHTEYHLPTRWLVVLDEDEAVTSSELEEITGRPNPRGTRQKIDDEEYNVSRLQ